MLKFRILAMWPAMACLAVCFGCQTEKDQRLGLLKGRDPFLGEKIPPQNLPTGRDRLGAKEVRDPFLRADNRNVESGSSIRERDQDWTELRPTTDRRATGSMTSRTLLSSPTGATADQLSAELERAGAKVFAPVRYERGYEVRVQWPTGPQGAMSGYVGSGSTSALALRDAYEQVRTDTSR